MKHLRKPAVITKTFFTALILGILTTAGFYACKKPTEGINLIVNTTSLSQAATLVQFTNANTSSTTALPSSFTVTITGDGAKYVQIDGGGTNFTVSNGMLPLSLTADAKPTVTNPIIFNVYANIPGFAPVSKTIAIVQTTAKIISVPLVEYANMPAGTSVLNISTTLTNGTSAAVTLATSPNATLSENSTLTIPAGTQMLDASGAVINAGALNSTIVQFGTSSPFLAKSFPGGMSPANVLDANGTAIPGGVQFVSAGLMGINMLAGTTVVKSFSKPIKATVQLQTGLINFNTGSTVKAGDVIPVWSLNETTGQWKSDGTATVALDGTGKLAATFNITHLSWWNMDWYRQNPAYNTTVHALNINLLPSQLPWVGVYEVQLQDSNGGYLAGFHDYHPETDFFQSETNFVLNQTFDGFTTITGKYGFGMAEVPTIHGAKVVVYNSYTGEIAGTSTIFDPTSASSVDVNLASPPPPDLNVVFNSNALCSGKQITVGFTGWLYIADLTKNLNTQTYVYNGTGSVGLYAGDKYTISTYYSGTNYATGEAVLTAADVSFPSSQVNGGSTITANGKYDAATKTLTLSSTIVLANCK